MVEFQIQIEPLRAAHLNWLKADSAKAHITMKFFLSLF